MAGLVLAVSALVAPLTSYPAHPLQRRWRDLNPSSMCGPGPARTVEFGQDGLVRTYHHFADGIFSADGHGDPVPYSASGNKILLGDESNQSEWVFTISGNSLTQRMLGMKGTEWENHVFRYEAE